MSYELIAEPFDLARHITERRERLEMIQPFVRLKRRIAMCEQPTWVVEPDGSWTKVNRGLSPEMMKIDEQLDEEIHHILHCPKPQP